MTMCKSLQEICTEKVCDEFDNNEIRLFIYLGDIQLSKRRGEKQNSRRCLKKSLRKKFSQCFCCNHYISRGNEDRFGVLICEDCWWNDPFFR